MGFRINTNVSAITAQKSLNVTSKKSADTLAQMASGSRINKSADDAAGLAISEKLKSQIVSNQQANRNANDGISMVQTAEGGLDEISNMLTRLRELSIQSASDTVGESERGFTDMEYQQLKSEIQRVSQVTEFNGTKLLSGEGDGPVDFQIGTNNDDFQDRISFNVADTNASIDGLGIDEIGVSSKDGAQSALAVIDKATEMVSGQRASLGALQNRLTSTSRNLETSNENMSAANSRIRDVDYAKVTAENATNNILAQAGTSVLSQANSSPQNALRLIG